MQDERNDNVPLVTDLDGTLIETDLLYVAAKQLLRKNVFYISAFAFWLIHGKALMKKKIFERVHIDTAALPFHAEVLQFLTEEHDRGRKIILATASPLTEAEKVAARLQLFSEVFGTENNINLKGPNKQALLVRRFGEKGFDYIGDSNADLPVFKSCRFAYLVNPSEGVLKKVKACAALKQVWG